MSSSFLAALDTANVFSNLAVVPVIGLLIESNRPLILTLFSELGAGVFTLLYHGSDFMNPGAGTSLFESYRRADLCTAQWLIVQSACDVTKGDLHTRQLYTLSIFLVHVFLQVSQFLLPLVTTYVALAYIVTHPILVRLGLVESRIVRWDYYGIALFFAAAGFVFFYLDDGLEYYYYHASWHACIFLSQFFLYLSMRPTLIAEHVRMRPPPPSEPAHAVQKELL